VLFYESGFKLSSKHLNLIAFNIQHLGMLLRVLKSAAANRADSLEVKLVQKPVPTGVEGESETLPFLSFSARVRDGQLWPCASLGWTGLPTQLLRVAT
jgi:hypothetical protein